MALHSGVYVTRVYTYQGGSGTISRYAHFSGGWHKIRAGDGGASILAILTAARTHSRSVDLYTDASGEIYIVYL